MQKVSFDDIGGEIIKDTSQYLLKDNKFGNNLVLSSTFLRANQMTNGHTHAGKEEVYFFVKGHGEMQIDGERFEVEKGDVVCINDGEYHRVFNTGHLALVFLCVFEGGRDH